MAFLKDLEHFFEKHIEGFFRKHFAAGIQPVEIGKKIVRAMEQNLQISVSKTYAANHYVVYLNQDDLGRMQSLEISLTDELAQYIIRKAKQQGLNLAGSLVVEMREDVALALGELRIETAFIQEKEELPATEMDYDGTQVFEGLNAVRDLSAKARHKAIPCAALRVREGVDTGKAWELGNNRMYIGRRQTNEIPLNDMNASRVHAYIALEDGRHVIHDAKSLNGTYVNEERIVRKTLCGGDCIKVGNSTLVYEVM